MKALSVKQPWASIICCGLKDVENRKWALKTLPIRVLIHAGGTPMPITEEEQYDWMPAASVWNIENYKIMGILPDRYKDFPKSAVVGVATIAACEENNRSLWAERGPGAEYQWVMKDVKMFKEPVKGVKGALGIFDIPSIDENNLPEFAEIPQIERNGTSLRIPLRKDILDSIRNGEMDNLSLFLTDLNFDFFAQITNDLIEPLPTETVTSFCGDEEVTKTLSSYMVYWGTDENDNLIEEEDAVGNVYIAAGVEMEF